jgi:hypothetical protein
MKLTSMQVSRTLRKFKARVIPENHPIVPELNGLFREYTFFLDHSGLSILEPVDAERKSARIVNLANWSDDDARLILSLTHPKRKMSCIQAIRKRHPGDP